MGNVQAALATNQAIQVWNPSQVILTGIAGSPPGAEADTWAMSSSLSKSSITSQPRPCRDKPAVDTRCTDLHNHSCASRNTYDSKRGLYQSTLRVQIS